MGDLASPEPRFTRGEYWLLEAVVEGTIPLHWLEAVNLAEIVNKPGHGLEHEALVDTLLRLVAAGLIKISTARSADSVTVNAEQIVRALNEPGGLSHVDSWTYYSLTALGGRQWEAFAAPDWDLFISWSADVVNDAEDGTLEAECISASRRLVETYLKSSRLRGDAVDEGSLRWDEVRPWRATYWKELPLGHRVIYRVREQQTFDHELGARVWAHRFFSTFPTFWYRWK